VLDRVRRGGVVVVADPSSPLNRSPVGSSAEAGLAAGTCTVAGLDRLARVEARSLLLLPVEGDDGSCFGDGSAAWLVLRSEGAGVVVQLGGAAPLVNENLDSADNAAVVTTLLAPGPGTRVVVVYDAVAGEDGELTLADLVPRRVWWAIAQLAVAFAVYVLWRARRFGRPVVEPQLVALPGSLLVRARGDLYRRSRSHQLVAAELRRDVERRIRRHLDLPPGGPLPTDEVATRSGLSPSEVERLLTGPTTASRARDVNRLAEELDDLLERLDRETPHRSGAAP
jgi:hypothetical protein